MQFKYTWTGQLLSIFVSHIEISFLFFVLWLIAFSVAETKIGGVVLTFISLFAYICAIYSVSNSICKNDSKSYSPLQPLWYKGAVLSLPILIINVILAVAHILVWKYNSDGDGLKSIGAVLINILNLFWFAPYQKLISMEKGTISLASYFYVFSVPLVVSFLGYFAGYKKVDITQKINKIMYEKKGK